MADILTELNDGIFTIKFNRPFKRNAITKEMMKTVIRELLRSATDDCVKMVVLTGIGDFYSSGNDFNPSGAFDVNEGLSIFQDFVSALIDYPKLLVAIVNGPAIGMACTTLALCDLVYATDRAYLYTPFTLLGLVPEGCSTYTFPRIFGNAKAARLLYLNEEIRVQLAALHGLVTEVFPHEQLHIESYARLRAYAKLPLQSLMMTKQLVRGWDRDILHQTNISEVQILRERFQSEDFMDAISKMFLKNKL